MLSTHDLVEIDHGDRDGAPAQALARAQPPLACDEPLVRRDDERMQEADIGDRARQRPDVAHVLAMPRGDGDGGDVDLLGHVRYCATRSGLGSPAGR